MAFVFVASTAFAAEQVADADGITITADTTDEAIAAAWGEGAAAISQNDDGSYTFKLLKNISWQNTKIFQSVIFRPARSSRVLF